jgi:hypothetical protein
MAFHIDKPLFCALGFCPYLNAIHDQFAYDNYGNIQA